MLAEWKLKPHIWQERLNDFYRESDAFLFETLVWNRLPLKNEIRSWIGEFIQGDSRGPIRILTFGDGLGIDSLYLAQAGHAVDYFEVSPRCVRFAQALAERMHTSLNVISAKDQIERRAYDVVICLDVLEHVPEPPSLVRELAGFLKPGGRLIAHAPFWHIHSAAVTHLAVNRKYCGDLARLYRSAGFRVIDGKFFWHPIVLEMTVGTSARTPVPLGRRLSLGLGGLLLSIARVWNSPHLFIAGRMSQ